MHGAARTAALAGHTRSKASEGGRFRGGAISARRPKGSEPLDGSTQRGYDLTRAQPKFTVPISPFGSNTPFSRAATARSAALVYLL